MTKYKSKNGRLAVFSDVEKSVLYDLPDFNEEQRLEYLSFSLAEEKLIKSRMTTDMQILCALQLGYFKSKQYFFVFDLKDVPKEDLYFISSKYFSGYIPTNLSINNKEIYKQRSLITELNEYKAWSKELEVKLNLHLIKTTKIDITLPVIIAETITWFKNNKIIRPGYSVLQNLISVAFNSERKRIFGIIKANINSNETDLLGKLLTNDSILSDLAALKQDAKNFKYNMIKGEREKLLILQPIYLIAMRIIPLLDISKHNILYYTRLANYYNAYDLKRFKEEQTNLYLLCYCWLKYQQLVDNLTEAFCYNVRKFELDLKSSVREQQIKYQQEQEKYNKNIGQLLALFPDKKFNDKTLYKVVREEAFTILPEAKITELSTNLIEKKSALELHWKFFDSQWNKFKMHLRPLFKQLEFTSNNIDKNDFLEAILLARSKLEKQATLPITEDIFIKIIPKRLEPYLLNEKSEICSERYEYWLYRQCKRKINSGDIHLNNSIKHRHLDNELMSRDIVKKILPTIDLPILKQSIKKTLKELIKELHSLWVDFNKKLKNNELTDLEYDKAKDHLSFKKIKIDKNVEMQHTFYEQLLSQDITDVLNFVDKECSFLKAFIPLQAYSNKKTPASSELIACLLAQSMNYGIQKMSSISDMDYNSLYFTKMQNLRMSTLKEANDIISDKTASLKIFSNYNLDDTFLFMATDGQKFETDDSTLKSRNSKKYFGKGKGVVAYTLLCNHIPIQSTIISPHEHESYYLFDIFANNTTILIPDIVTGDMHSINKCNFAIMNWFKSMLAPRFTNLDNEIKHTCCGYKKSRYKNYLIKPFAEIDIDLIIEEWPELKRILVSLHQKEVSQSIIVKKLCTYSKSNKTRKALFEYDKLIRSIYTLKYLLDPKLKKQVHASQNRIESYHQLRAAISKVNGKKELIGKNDIEIEISNECGRLVANAIIYYNSALLSKLLEKFLEENDVLSLKILKKISPVAYQHIHLLGHYTFNQKINEINLSELILKIDFQDI